MGGDVLIVAPVAAEIGCKYYFLNELSAILV
jgi:hypothetical protein